MVECINIWQTEDGERAAQNPKMYPVFYWNDGAAGVIEGMEENGAEEKQINGKRMEK